MNNHEIENEVENEIEEIDKISIINVPFDPNDIHNQHKALQYRRFDR
jgi:hypothetical protein